MVLRLGSFALALALLGCGADRPGAATQPAAPDGRLVLAVLAPERLLVADPRTGATRERKLPGGTLCHGPVLAAGGRVLFAGSRRGASVALSLPLSLRGRARSLGRSDAMVASGGRVWLGRRRPHGGILLRAADGDGQVHARVARWGWIAGVVGSSLLVEDEHGLRLGREPPMPGAWPLAVDGERFAWCRGDGNVCRAAGVRSPDGAQALDPPPGVAVLLGTPAAFSPDGRRLALPVRAGGSDRVAVVDLARDRWSVGRARLTGYRALAWSPSGRWVYFTGSRHRVVAWSPGSAPRALPIRPGGTVMSIATG